MKHGYVRKQIPKTQPSFCQYSYIFVDFCLASIRVPPVFHPWLKPCLIEKGSIP